LQRNQQAQEAKQAQLRMQIMPHAVALKGLQARLQGIDPKQNPEEYAAITHDIARNLAEVRQLINPDKNPQGNFFERGISDKLHLTSLKNREKKEADKRAQEQTQDESSAQSIAQGQVPYTETVPFKMELQKEQAAQKLAETRLHATADEQKRADFAAYQQAHPEYAGSFEEWTAQQTAAGRSGAPETEYQKAQLDYKNKMLALQEAKQRAASDPNNPAAKAALLRAQSDAEKSHAYMIRALAGAKGTDEGGAPLPGALETPNGTPVGSMFASNFYKSAQGIAQLNDAQGAINQVGSAVDKLYSSGGSLANPNVASALANPEWTAAKLAQGIVGQELSQEEREAVIAIRSAQENIQGMRKAAGGGLSNEQVNRLEAQLPGPNTPNAEFAKRQLQYLDLTLNRLAQGVPEAVGGPQFQGAWKKALDDTRKQQTSGNAHQYAIDENGKKRKVLDPKAQLPKGWKWAD
jgi:hypothetical protein